MTYSTLRATLAAEMPPGWLWQLRDHGDHYEVSMWRYGYLPEHSCAGASPEALLMEWREMKGRMG